MSDVGDDDFMRYVYRGEEGEIIPDGATHIIVREDVRVILSGAFKDHPNIVEVICHEDVEKIERTAFFRCPCLRRVIIPGVKIVEKWAFFECDALTDVACGKLEIIGLKAFQYCESLRSINLPSARIVERCAFACCDTLMDVKFGSKLERFDESAFLSCTSLERITIPLKDGLITADDTFQECENLQQVDLAEGELHETIAALYFEEWRVDLYQQIDEINQTLPTADVGFYEDEEYQDVGEKAVAIRSWIRSVPGKILHYKAKHRRVLDDDVAPSLQHDLPQDIVRNSVLPFLELPSNAFE